MTDFSGDITLATAQNWKRLNTNPEGRLTRRANKRRSNKRFLPLEYISCKENIPFFQNLLERVNTEGWKPEEIMMSICVNLLKADGIFDCPHVQEVLSPYKDIPIRKELLNISFPKNEYDILGVIYQGLLFEGKKNCSGSYYTPQKIASNMTCDLSFSNGQTILDPCCGSGAYLLSCRVENPSQLIGVDIDSVAVMIAKINLLLKFNTHVFTPNIYLSDFLGNSEPGPMEDYKKKSFDYIVTNPPWGAVSDSAEQFPEITSRESFSCFFVRAFDQVKEGGTIRFLFPESVLNVKTHKDIRFFMLCHGSIDRITLYGDTFTGVTTRYVDISIQNQPGASSLSLCSPKGEKRIDISSFHKTKNKVFNLLDRYDTDLIDKIASQGVFTLKDSVWALGIVTGDNTKKLFDTPQKHMEPIYTGKEVCPYVLKQPKKYIVYDRSSFQQAAKDEIYRVNEKLVYKFISSKLVFAYDDKGQLFLNSANILIPNINGMSIKTVLAFLNSPLYQFLYQRLFGEIKILKGNLTELPFPSISKQMDADISGLVDWYLTTRSSQTMLEIQSAVYDVFSLTEEERHYIGGVADGKIA